MISYKNILDEQLKSLLLTAAREIGDRDARISELEATISDLRAPTEGYLTVDRSWVPEHVAEAGRAAVALVMESGDKNPRTLALVAYTEMLLAAAEEHES